MYLSESQIHNIELVDLELVDLIGNNYPGKIRNRNKVIKITESSKCKDNTWEHYIRFSCL
jgi:hypothetical protein